MSKKKYVRPRRRIIDQQAVAEFLKDLGFETEKIFQEWRHLTAFGIFKGKKAVFKLASTLATARYTQNEFNWNHAVHLASKNKKLNFTVPENFSSGHYGKLFYFIAQRFMGKSFAQQKTLFSNEAGNLIKKVATTTREVELLQISPNTEFAQRHTASNKKVSAGQKLLNASSEWADQVPKNLDAFLKVIDDSKNSIRTCPAHGDFVIRQMYDVDGKIGLIDGEHSGLHVAYHYDVAQFYLRLRSDYNALKQAKQYLQFFYNLLPADEQKTFWQELKPPLIQRYIGELWGAAKKPQKLKELEQLGKEIIEDKIF